MTDSNQPSPLDVRVATFLPTERPTRGAPGGARLTMGRPIRPSRLPRLASCPYHRLKPSRSIPRTPSRGLAAALRGLTHEGLIIIYDQIQTGDEGVVSQPEYTLAKPSNGPNDRDHLNRQPGLTVSRASARPLPASGSRSPAPGASDGSNDWFGLHVRRARHRQLGAGDRVAIVAVAVGLAIGGLCARRSGPRAADRRRRADRFESVHRRGDVATVTTSGRKPPETLARCGLPKIRWTKPLRGRRIDPPRLRCSARSSRPHSPS